MVVGRPSQGPAAVPGRPPSRFLPEQEGWGAAAPNLPGRPGERQPPGEDLLGGLSAKNNWIRALI